VCIRPCLVCPRGGALSRIRSLRHSALSLTSLGVAGSKIQLLYQTLIVKLEVVQAAAPPPYVHYGAAAAWALNPEHAHLGAMVQPTGTSLRSIVSNADQPSYSAGGAAAGGGLQQRVAASMAAVDEMQHTAAAAARVQVQQHPFPRSLLPKWF
jgi:hypothetical protein